MTKRARDIGRKGQADFISWCNGAGLTANPPIYDEHGWDVYVEFDIENAGGKPRDLSPGAPKCKVQIKSTDRETTVWSINLRNMEMLSKEALPVFYCLIYYAKKSRAEKVYLRHLDETLIRETFQMLRDASKKKISDRIINKIKIRVKFRESDRIDPEDIKNQLNKYWIEDGYEGYIKTKSHYIRTVGYEDGVAKITFSTSADGREKILNSFLGIKTPIQIQRPRVRDVRFGIEVPLIDENVEFGTIEIRSQPRIVNVKWTTIGEEYGPSYSAELFIVPPSLGTNALRIKGLFFEILLTQIDRRVLLTLNYEINDGIGKRNYYEWRDIIQTLKIYLSGKTKMEIDHKKINIETKFDEEKNRETQGLLNTIENTWKALRQFGATDEMMLGLGEIIRAEQCIIKIDQINDDPSKVKIVFEKTDETTVGLKDTSSVLLPIQMDFEKVAIVVVFIIDGKLEFESDQIKFNCNCIYKKRFNLFNINGDLANKIEDFIIRAAEEEQRENAKVSIIRKTIFICHA